MALARTEFKFQRGVTRPRHQQDESFAPSRPQKGLLKLTPNFTKFTGLVVLLIVII